MIRRGFFDLDHHHVDHENFPGCALCSVRWTPSEDIHYRYMLVALYYLNCKAYPTVCPVSTEPSQLSGGKVSRRRRLQVIILTQLTISQIMSYVRLLYLTPLS